jgi:HPt (histidine-containing phosphotransfer) domain-containing protein
MSFLPLKVNKDLTELMPGYLKNRRQDIPVLREYLNAEDYDNIRRLGHRIKGSGAAYELNAISEIGEMLVDATISFDNVLIEKQISLLEHFLDDVKIIFI